MTRWRWHTKTTIQPVISCDNVLTLLNNPAGANIDIVAIHGLNPLNKRSHAEDTWTANGKLWLRDFLPHQIPTARILLYGYNSNIAFSSSIAGVREQAEDLLEQIQGKRKECPDRPIIFIAHSLGGLIVKRALVHAKSVDASKPIWSSTYGLVFFGVPHRGGNGANLGSVLAGVVRAMTGSRTNTYMQALQRNSLFSKISLDDFRQQLEDFQVLSFYETQPLSGTRFLVVDKESATLGLPGNREKQIPLDGDHRQICKFASEEDSRYQRVGKSIQSFAEDAITLEREGRWNRNGIGMGNNALSEGEKNKTCQVGQQNQSNTSGRENAAKQFGSLNRSKIVGYSNSVVQVEMSPDDTKKYLVEIGNLRDL